MAHWNDLQESGRVSRSIDGLSTECHQSGHSGIRRRAKLLWAGCDAQTGSPPSVSDVLYGSHGGHCHQAQNEVSLLAESKGAVAV